MKILIASPIFPDTIRELEVEHDVVCEFNASVDELKRAITDREILIFRSGVSINAEVMACAPDLRLLIRAGSGMDNLDLNYVETRGLELQRIQLPGAKSVAELTFTMFLGLARQIRKADSKLREGRWLKHEITGHLLTGKTLGIVGTGNIGTVTGQLGVAWGMNVIGCVEHPTKEQAVELERQEIRLTDFNEVISTADYISVHVPLTAETRNLINAEVLLRMKSGAFLVNLARGGVVDEQALYDALTCGSIAGAGLDVHENEGEGKISPLAGLENVILTPHIGAGTVDTQREVGYSIMQIIRSQID
jgi:D-3-phosphoglycerate dehydrogenase